MCLLIIVKIGINLYTCMYFSLDDIMSFNLGNQISTELLLDIKMP